MRDPANKQTNEQRESITSLTEVIKDGTAKLKDNRKLLTNQKRPTENMLKDAVAQKTRRSVR